MRAAVYLMTLNEKSRVVKKSRERPPRKIISATCSNNVLLLLTPRIDKKDNIQLAINRMMATTVTSSIIVVSDLLSNFKEVSTIKQMPNRLDDAFRICGDLSLVCFTPLF